MGRAALQYEADDFYPIQPKKLNKNSLLVVARWEMYQRMYQQALIVTACFPPLPPPGLTMASVCLSSASGGIPSHAMRERSLPRRAFRSWREAP
jgi:hypothetical protein